MLHRSEARCPFEKIDKDRVRLLIRRGGKHDSCRRQEKTKSGTTVRSSWRRGPSRHLLGMESVILLLHTGFKCVIARLRMVVPRAFNPRVRALSCSRVQRLRSGGVPPWLPALIDAAGRAIGALTEAGGWFGPGTGGRRTTEASSRKSHAEPFGKVEIHRGPDHSFVRPVQAQPALVRQAVGAVELQKVPLPLD